MDSRTDRKTGNSDPDIIRHLAEKYGIVDEGSIVDLTDLEGREELTSEILAEDVKETS